jgi:Ca-activated chloride channel homolog
LGFILFAKRREKHGGLRFPSGELLNDSRKSYRIRLIDSLVILRTLSSILILMALARPQWILEEVKVKSEGIDIVLAIDVSTSMLAEDFRVGERRASRLDAVKEVAREFIRQRKNDRIGMVIFAGRAYTACPLTLDHEWILENLDRIEIGMVEDNTALGSALSAALTRLKGSPARAKSVILLTDGRNNAGKIPPLTAAAAARALKIRVYAVGAGSKGLAPYPVKDPFGKVIYRPIPLDIDEDLLNQIATRTESRYFRASDTTSLRETFKEIDRLEKTSFEQKIYYEHQECFYLFLIPGLVLLLFEIILKNTVLRKIP